MKKVYIAGPMTGYKDFNFPAFMKAEEDFTKMGFEVFNPAKKDIEAHGEGIADNPTGDQKLAAEKDGFDLRKALAWDTARICESDGIVMLGGWEKSQGAFAEWALAKALGLQIIYTGEQIG